VISARTKRRTIDIEVTKMNKFVWGLTAIASLAGATAASAVTLDEVFELLQVGISEDIILDKVEADGDPIRLETEDIVALKRVGASDQLLRELISFGDPRSAQRNSRDDDADWTSDYSLPERNAGIRVELGFDPFGYNWYANPYYYSYYYPFRSIDFGFYHAGWIHRSWWGWGGHRASIYRNYCNAAYYRYHHHDYYHHNDYAHHDSRYRSGRNWGRDRTRVEKDGRTRTRSGVSRSQAERSRNPARLQDRERSTRDRTAVDRKRTSRSRDRTVQRSRPRTERPRSTAPRTQSRTDRGSRSKSTVTRTRPSTRSSSSGERSRRTRSR